MSLHVGFGGRLFEDAGVGVNERQVLALKGSEGLDARRPGSGLASYSLCIHLRPEPRVAVYIYILSFSAVVACSSVVALLCCRRASLARFSCRRRFVGLPFASSAFVSSSFAASSRPSSLSVGRVLPSSLDRTPSAAAPARAASTRAALVLAVSWSTHRLTLSRASVRRRLAETISNPGVGPCGAFPRSTASMSRAWRTCWTSMRSRPIRCGR